MSSTTVRKSTWHDCFLFTSVSFPVSQVEVIGGADMYHAVCRSCYGGLLAKSGKENCEPSREETPPNKVSGKQLDLSAQRKLFGQLQLWVGLRWAWSMNWCRASKPTSVICTCQMNSSWYKTVVKCKFGRINIYLVVYVVCISFKCFLINDHNQTSFIKHHFLYNTCVYIPVT